MKFEIYGMRKTIKVIFFEILTFQFKNEINTFKKDYFYCFTHSINFKFHYRLQPCFQIIPWKVWDYSSNYV